MKGSLNAEIMVKKAVNGMKRTRDIDVPYVALLGDDIVNKVPVFRSRMHSRCLAADRLLKAGVSDDVIEFSASSKETQAVGDHASNTMRNKHTIPELEIVTHSFTPVTIDLSLF